MGVRVVEVDQVDALAVVLIRHAFALQVIDGGGFAVGEVGVALPGAPVGQFGIADAGDPLLDTALGQAPVEPGDLLLAAPPSSGGGKVEHFHVRKDFCS